MAPEEETAPEIGGTEASVVAGERGVARGPRERRRGERERWLLKRGNWHRRLFISFPSSAIPSARILNSQRSCAILSL
jgi:hypothetical protein